MPDVWPRTIVHADMDAFYAAVEQLDDPRLRGRPVLVGPRSSRGVVLTASYEARPFGVGSAMPMAEARRRCPEALVVPPRFERYLELSKRVMDTFADFSPQVEALSLDEAFLDMSGCERVLGGPARIGRRIKDAVRAATGGLTVSVGISGTKFVAKVASGHGKPDGLTIVPPEHARDWLAPLSVAHLWGAGPKMQGKLERLGLATIGDVARREPRELADALGSAGLHFHALALAHDARRVDGSRAPRSIGSERTLERDTDSPRDIEFQLRLSADRVARRLRKTGYRAGGVRVKLKRDDFRLFARQRRLAEATDVADELYLTAVTLLPAFGRLGPVRLVGIAGLDLVRADSRGQQELLPSADGRKRALDLALDRIEARFGPGAVSRASARLGDRSIGGGVDLDFLRGPVDDDDSSAPRGGR